MKRLLRWYDFITINSYWFALTTRSQTISPLLLPILVQEFVGEDVKGAALGSIRLWALMTAVLIQALMGMLSDRSTHPWGRRRPFILAGSIGEVLVFALLGFVSGMEGSPGYTALFAVYVFSMFSSNVAHAATQGLIPDLVTEDKRGRFSGVKALLELPVPVIFVSFVMGRLVSQGELWLALIILMIVMAVCAGLAMLVREERLEKPPFELDWQPFLRLAAMTAAFTLVILGTGAGVRWFLNLDLPFGAAKYWVTALTGLLAIGLAVALGVIASLRIGVGKDIQYQSSFKWWVINRLAFLVGSTNVATFLVFFLQERFPHLEGEKAAAPAAMITMFVGVFILLTALPSGWLADRFGKKNLVAIAGLLAASGVGVMMLVPSMTAIYVAGCLVGAGVGLFYSANWALGTEIVPREQAGRFLGLSNLAGAGAGAIGAYIAGPIADAAGYTLIMGIYGILFLFSILALPGIREKRPGSVSPVV
ncbi:MAG: MFS transporter [Chloroflexota bacterium]|jgi:MFS family permease